MKIKVTEIANLLELANYIKNVENKTLSETKEKLNGFRYNNLPLILDAPNSDIEKLTEMCTFEIIEETQYQFKPFDQVLVRDDEESNWKVGIYSHYEKESGMPYICTGSQYAQCIPYNENTAHLLGTCKPYKKPDPKVWKVTCHKNNEVFHFTNDELKNFIEKAVINNKDIQWFTTTYDGNNN